MYFYSVADKEKKHSFYIDDNAIKISRLLRFYCWWSNKEASALRYLPADLSKIKSVEASIDLLKSALNDVRDLPPPQSPFPNWRIFASLNHWFETSLSKQLNQLNNFFTSKLIEAKIELPKKIEEAYLQLPKLAHIDSKGLSNYLEIRQREIRGQDSEKPVESYAAVRDKMKSSQSAQQRLIDHRNFVQTTEAPVAQLFLSPLVINFTVSMAHPAQIKHDNLRLAFRALMLRWLGKKICGTA